MCKFWINSGKCHFGDQCEFVHVDASELKAARAQWLEQRIHLKRLRAQHDEDPLDPHSKRVKNQRAEVFCEWLINKFGRQHLTSGRGVLDIAGGRGGVSFELWNKRKIPCQLIDPVRARSYSSQADQPCSNLLCSWCCSDRFGSPRHSSST